MKPTDRRTWLDDTRWSEWRAKKATDNLYEKIVTVENENELAASTIDQLHYGPSMCEYPAHWPIGHFLQEAGFKLSNCRQ